MNDIIKQNYSTIIIPEISKFKKIDQLLNKWLLEGGTLVRFAGDVLEGKNLILRIKELWKNKIYRRSTYN